MLARQGFWGRRAQHRVGFVLALRLQADPFSPPVHRRYCRCCAVGGARRTPRRRARGWCARPHAKTQGARLVREARQQRATTAAAEARRAARDDIRHEHDALYVAKYATKAKPADHTTGCAPPAADAAAEAAAASGGGRWRCFTMDKESPFAAHAAAAGAVAAPLGVLGNKRVECDGGLYVRWDHTAKCVTKPVAPAAPCNTATPAACEDGDDMPALVSASDSDSE